MMFFQPSTISGVQKESSNDQRSMETEKQNGLNVSFGEGREKTTPALDALSMHFPRMARLVHEYHPHHPNRIWPTEYKTVRQ